MLRANRHKRYAMRSLIAGVLLLVGGGVSAGASASDPFLLDDTERFGISQGDFSKMRIVPVYMMEDETLFRAAEEERTSDMSMSQRILNNRWLLEEKRYSFSASVALRNYVKTYLIQSLKEQNAQKQQELTPGKQVDLSGLAQFKDVSNYDLRLSDSRFRLRFTYEFN